MTRPAAGGQFRFEPIPAATLDGIRAAGMDEAGNQLTVQTDTGGGSPLRCCLRETVPGDRVLLIAYTPPGGRGGYAERQAAFLPMVSRIDFSIVQSVFANVFDTKQTFEIRLDILNFGNLLNKNWGQSQHFVNLQPLIVATAAQGGPADAQGRAQYTMREVNGALMDHTFEKNAFLADVYSLQLGLKYFF